MYLYTVYFNSFIYIRFYLYLLLQPGLINFMVLFLLMILLHGLLVILGITTLLHFLSLELYLMRSKSSKMQSFLMLSKVLGIWNYILIFNLLGILVLLEFLLIATSLYFMHLKCLLAVLIRFVFAIILIRFNHLSPNLWYLKQF